MKTILDLGRREARKFFFKSKNYFSLDLPSYYQFDRLLGQIRDFTCEHSITDYYHPLFHPRHFEQINYAITCNKDGHYAWRKQQMLHPFFYAEIVNLLTQGEVWEQICAHLKALRTPKIVCASMLLAPTQKLNRNEQDIFNWSGNFTNATIRKALEYKYMLVTDLSNCYDSLSLHLFAWALHGRRHPYNSALVGWRVCEIMQDMLYGQSCGVPQGSALTDFIAETILSYIDCIICGRLASLADVQVLRYRDDYRIFANSLATAEQAMKILVETLTEFDLKINLSKTFVTTDVIKHAFKPDRWAWKHLTPMLFGEGKLNTIKSLMMIKEFSDQYPTCGSVKSALCELYVREIYEAGCHDDIWQIVSIVSDIMYRHPGTWPHCVAILSRYLNEHPSAIAMQVVERIQQKFADIPNTEYLEIWLQRLSIKFEPFKPYRSPLCRLLYDKNARIWNSDWLDIVTDLSDSDIVNFDEIASLPIAIPTTEAVLFSTGHGSG